jgi:hypothetical protein
VLTWFKRKFAVDLHKVYGLKPPDFEKRGKRGIQTLNLSIDRFSSVPLTLNPIPALAHLLNSAYGERIVPVQEGLD